MGVVALCVWHSFWHPWNVLEREKQPIVAQLEQRTTLYINGSNAELLLSTSRTFALYSCGFFNIVRRLSNQKFCSLYQNCHFLRRRTLVIKKNINDFFLCFNEKRRNEFRFNWKYETILWSYIHWKAVGRKLKETFFENNSIWSTIWTLKCLGQFIQKWVFLENLLYFHFHYKNYLWLKFYRFSAMNCFYFHSLFIQLIILPIFYIKIY